jgi:hypothetical protein
MTETITEVPPPPALVAALKRAQERARELEAFIRWEDELFANPHLSGNHKLELRAMRRAVQRAQTHDEEGRARINLTTLAEHIGISPDTMSRGFKLLKQCGVIANHALKPEVQENGEYQTRHYVTLDEDRLKRPKDIQPPQPRNHGGNRYRCVICGSERVTIKRRVTLICKCCQHESLIEESERDQEPESDKEQDQGKNFDVQDRNLQDIQKPVSPPCGAGETPDGPDTPGGEEEQATVQDDLRAAACLLLELSGESDEHIEMSRRSEKKYYTVDRALTLDDVLDHLQGGKARGALCSRPDGLTRALCWDGDDAERWAMLSQAARQLAEAGYLPMLEPSPVGRGGHLWLIYDGLVDAMAARHHVYFLAPQLAELAEYWPGPKEARCWNKVRLPGGKYARPGVSAWCQLISVADGEVSTDGRSAAHLLLTHQTSVSIVPAIQSQNDQAQADEGAGEEPERPALHIVDRDEPPASDQDAESTMRPGELDSQWYAKYNTPEGARLWFAWTSQYLADWWNRQHSIEELLPSERNGYGRACWRGERTASVAKRGEQWADFGASARQSDGSPDTGDALELQVRLTGAPKPEVMRQAARELLQVARQALESAARNGEPLPAWIEEIITDAGRAHYERCAAAAGHEKVSRNTEAFDPAMQSDQEQQARPSPCQEDGATGGLTGFSPLQPDTPASKMPPGGVDEGYKEPASAVPSSSALMDEMQQLEAIKQYGERRGWAALVIDGVEVIPAGRAAWLRFIWLSSDKQRQQQVYQYVSGR